VQRTWVSAAACVAPRNAWRSTTRASTRDASRQESICTASSRLAAARTAPALGAARSVTARNATPAERRSSSGARSTHTVGRWADHSGVVNRRRVLSVVVRKDEPARLARRYLRDHPTGKGLSAATSQIGCSCLTGAGGPPPSTSSSRAAQDGASIRHGTQCRTARPEPLRMLLPHASRFTPPR